nr:immunoglobulin heavy chain junction region [Macaca mulatta]MOX00708.1 immunoglobulin heavy chain junction region [Macaca mulatta]MOX01334.1 immunoglobulin heavy chain junction region [Macaca mulatta]MOX02853.1 immunoglobulin heavy chain junction region [Macaca mulatta]MOX03619.1 immunoglobulin heavy chain junction region [Macaca mulatta]
CVRDFYGGGFDSW